MLQLNFGVFKFITNSKNPGNYIYWEGVFIRICMPFEIENQLTNAWKLSLISLFKYQF